MNGIQLLLAIVIISLTSLLLIIGYQVFLVIKEARKVVTKVNDMLDHPETKIASFFESFRKRAS